MSAITKACHETLWLMRDDFRVIAASKETGRSRRIIKSIAHYLRSYHKFLCSRYCDDLYKHDYDYADSPLFFELRNKAESRDRKHGGLIEISDDWGAVYYYWKLIISMKLHGNRYRAKLSRLTEAKSVKLLYGDPEDLAYYAPSPTLDLCSGPSEETVRDFLFQFFAIANEMDPANLDAKMNPYFVATGLSEEGIKQRGKPITSTDREFELYDVVMDLQTAMGVELKEDRIFLAKLYESETMSDFCDVWIDNLKDEGLLEKDRIAQFTSRGGES